MTKRVSVTELTQFSTCQRSWYLQRVLKAKGTPFMPFIKGGAVHDFIAYWVHQKKVNREFFYKTTKSAQDGFVGYWLGEVWPPYKNHFSDQAKWAAIYQGKKCVSNYMKIARGKGYPLFVEKTLSIYIPELGCTLVGKIDQIRPTSPDWAKKQGIKEPGKVLIDIKTSWPQYWPRAKKASRGEILKTQTSLVNNIQPTAYHYLHNAVLGGFPDTFVFWFLGGDKPRIITTNRESFDIDNLFHIIANFMESINGVNIEDYPKTANSYSCKSCRFWDSCWSNEQRPEISMPFRARDSARPSGVTAPELSEEGPKQPRFKMPGIKKRKPTEEEKKLAEQEEYERRMNGG